MQQHKIAFRYAKTKVNIFHGNVIVIKLKSIEVGRDLKGFFKDPTNVTLLLKNQPTREYESQLNNNLDFEIHRELDMLFNATAM